MNKREYEEARREMEERAGQVFQWVFIFLVIGVLIGITCTIAYAAPTYEERVAKAIAQNEAEIRRKHEVNIERARAEAYALALELSADETNFYVSSESSSEVVNNVSQTQTA